MIKSIHFLGWVSESRNINFYDVSCGKLIRSYIVWKYVSGQTHYSTPWIMNAFVISYSLRQGVSTSVPLSCPDPAWTAFLVVSDLENGDKSQCGMTLAALPVTNNRREQKTQTTFGIRRVSYYWYLLKKWWDVQSNMATEVEEPN